MAVLRVTHSVSAHPILTVVVCPLVFPVFLVIIAVVALASSSNK